MEWPKRIWSSALADAWYPIVMICQRSVAVVSRTIITCVWPHPLNDRALCSSVTLLVVAYTISDSVGANTTIVVRSIIAKWAMNNSLSGAVI